MNVNEEVPSQAPQNPQVPIKEGAISNVVIRATIHSLTQMLATQVAMIVRCKYPMLTLPLQGLGVSQG